MLDAAADRFQCRRDDIAAIGDGGSAEHDGQFRAGFEHLVERAGERGALMRHPPLGDDCRAGGGQPLGGDRSVFSITLVASPGSTVDTTPTLRMR